MQVVGWRGLQVALDGPGALVEAVVAQLPPFWSPTASATPAAVADGVLATATLTGTGDAVRLDLPDDLGYAGPAGAETARACASRIELFLVSRLTDVAPVHAGVVAWRGRAIVVPGPSMAGKSTLVRALIDAGATYLSDEFALITPAGTVAPYPRLMTVRGGAGSERVAAADAARVDDPPCPIAVIATVRWEPGAPAMRPRSPAEAVLDLVANSVTVRREPDLAMSAFAAAARTARCLAGTRDDAATAAQELLGLADR